MELLSMEILAFLVLIPPCFQLIQVELKNHTALQTMPLPGIQAIVLVLIIRSEMA